MVKVVLFYLMVCWKIQVLKKLREEILKECIITAIISLPKFAFAPYTKEKTYALYSDYSIFH